MTSTKPEEEKNASIGIIANALSSGRLSINSLDDGSGIVLDMEREQMMTMNASAIRLMQAIADGSITLEALTGVLSRHYEISVESASRDVQSFVQQTARQLQGF